MTDEQEGRRLAELETPPRRWALALAVGRGEPHGVDSVPHDLDPRRVDAVVPHQVALDHLGHGDDASVALGILGLLQLTLTPRAHALEQPEQLPAERPGADHLAEHGVPRAGVDVQEVVAPAQAEIMDEGVRQAGDAGVQRASPVEAPPRARHGVAQEVGWHGGVVVLECDAVDFVPAFEQPGREPGGPGLEPPPVGREPIEDQHHPQRGPPGGAVDRWTPAPASLRGPRDAFIGGSIGIRIVSDGPGP